MKYFRKKNKTSTISLYSVSEFNKNIKSSKKNKKKNLTLTSKLIEDETTLICRLINQIFDKRDPCLLDIGIDPNSVPVDYLPPVPIREITISKNEESGEYGFFLRKKVNTDILNFKKKKAIFIDSFEHSAILGDRLLSVNGNSVDNLTAEEVACEIMTSGAFAICQVQQLREFTEIYKFLLNYDQQNLWSNSESIQERKISLLSGSTVNLKQQEYWLIHRHGFSSCFIDSKNDLGEVGESHINISMPQFNRKCISVPSEALERINPHELDFIEDCSNLWYLNESGIIHNIRSRYFNNLFTTFAGRSLIRVNSFMSSLTFCERMSGIFYNQNKVESLPPHIYSMAQEVLQAMQFGNKKNQTIIFTGHENSGKGEAFKNSVTHLLRIHDSEENRSFSVSKWAALYLVFQSLTNLEGDGGYLNNMAVLCRLYYDSIGSLVGGSVKLEFFDCFRSFRYDLKHNIFIFMMAGLDVTLKGQLSLIDPSTTLRADEDFYNNAKRWEKFVESCKILDVSDSEMSSVICMLAAIHHLQCSLNSGSVFTHDSFSHAAKCLNLTPETLFSLINHDKISQDKSITDLVMIFIAAVYQNLLDCVVHFVNRSIANSDKTQVSNSINLLYTPGISTFKHSYRNIHSLFLGYFQEKVNQLQFNFIFKAPLDVFGKENIDIDGFYVQSTAEEAVEVFENRRKLSGDAVSSKVDKIRESTGILRLIDNAFRSDFNAIQFVSLVQSKNKYSSIVKPGTSQSSFVFLHCNSMLPVEYNCEDWPSQIGCYYRLLRTKNKLINSKIDLFSDILLRSANFSHSYFTTNLGSKIEATADGLLEHVISSDLSFVYCICPSLDAESSKRDNGSCANFSSSLSSLSSGMCVNDIFETAFVRIQIRAMLLVSATLMFRYGYPDNMSINSFIKAYSLLGSSVRTDVIDEIMQRSYVEPHDYAVGSDKIFMKDGVLVRVNECRDRLMADYMISFQSKIRTFLAQKKTQRIRSIQASIKCVQYNMRLYLDMKKWKWWTLYLSLLPFASLSGMDGPIRALKDKLEQNDVKYTKELLEKDNAIIELKNQIERLMKEIMEDKISLSEAGEVLENAMEENAILKERVKQLEEKNDSCSSNQDALKMDELTKRISELEHVVEEKNSDIRYWKRQTTRQGNQNLDLKRQASMKSSRPSTPNESEAENLRNEISQLKVFYERQICELQEEYSKLPQSDFVDAENYNSKLRVATEKIIELEEEVGDLNQRLNRLNHHCHSVEGELASMRMKETELLDEAEEKLRAKTREASSKCDNLEFMLETEQKRSSKLVATNFQLKEELEKMKRAASSNSKDIEKLKSKLSKTKVMLKDAQMERNPVSRGFEDSGVQRLQKLLDEAESSLVVATRAKSEVECELMDCKMLVENYKNSRDEMENRLRQVVKDMTENELLIEDKQTEIENVQRSVTSLKLEASVLRETVVVKEGDIMVLKKQNATLKDKISELEGAPSRISSSGCESSSVVEGLRAQIDFCETQKSRLQTQLKSVRFELLELKQELNEQDMKNVRLGDQLRYSENLVRSLEKEREVLKEDKQVLSSKFGKLQQDNSLADEVCEGLKSENAVLKKRLLEIQNSMEEDIEDSYSSSSLGIGNDSTNDSNDGGD